MVDSVDFSGADLISTAGVYYNDPDDIRFELALESAEAHHRAGIPYVVVDASPLNGPNGWHTTWVEDAHRQRGAIVIRAEVAGIATQRQQGVAFAVENGAEKVLGLEPEKVGMVAFADDVSLATKNTICRVVLNGLPSLKSRQDFEAYLSELEADFAKLGYRSS